MEKIIVCGVELNYLSCDTMIRCIIIFFVLSQWQLYDGKNNNLLYNLPRKSKTQEKSDNKNEALWKLLLTLNCMPRY